MTTVLIVDDEPAIRSALRKLLERGGLAVFEADCVREALERLAAEPAIEAVKLDDLQIVLDAVRLALLGGPVR